MTATTDVDVEGFTITEPGVYDLPEDIYHAHKASLSFSGAKRLLPPSCPAIFRHEQLNGRPEKRSFDFGHAVHSLILGIGQPIVIVQRTAKDGTNSDADNYATKSAQEHRDAIYAAGHVPLLRAEHDAALTAVRAVRAHPNARHLFEQGTAEESLFWHDERYGVWRRARTDWRTTLPDGRPAIVDLKTCRSASPEAIGKSVYEYRYHWQQAWYEDAAAILHGEPHTFLFVFVETNPPHPVTVCELDPEAVEIGRRFNDQALDLYAECAATDTWPGHVPADDIPLISLPAWAYKETAA